MKKDKINNARTLEEYIGIYENSWEHTIDMSPYGHVRDTERKMIKELKKLLERNYYQLTKRENKILDFLAEKEKWVDLKIKRNSDREFDIDIMGKTGVEIIYEFSSWMPLAIIANINWTDKRIWDLTDAYGKKGLIPSQGCDWSGIRDSSVGAVYDMMNIVLEITEKDIEDKELKHEKKA